MLFAITNFNVVISVFGGWLVLVGLFSHLRSDAFYLSEAREPSPPPESLRCQEERVIH